MKAMSAIQIIRTTIVKKTHGRNGRASIRSGPIAVTVTTICKIGVGSVPRASAPIYNREVASRAAHLTTIISRVVAINLAKEVINRVVTSSVKAVISSVKAAISSAPIIITVRVTTIMMAAINSVRATNHAKATSHAPVVTVRAKVGTTANKVVISHAKVATVVSKVAISLAREATAVSRVATSHAKVDTIVIRAVMIGVRVGTCLVRVMTQTQSIA